MTTAQQAALVDLAAAEGRALEGGLASPALVLAVKVCLPIMLTPVKTPHMFITLKFARPPKCVYMCPWLDSSALYSACSWSTEIQRRYAAAANKTASVHIGGHCMLS